MSNKLFSDADSDLDVLIIFIWIELASNFGRVNCSGYGQSDIVKVTSFF